jgi:hypothetical protein
MTTRNVTPVLLAGSIVLASLSSFAQAKLETVQEARPEDTRLTRMEDLVDVPSSHWAYDSLSELVEKYDVVEGYSIGNGKYKFKGNNYATRYEMAAAIRDVLYLVRSGKLYMNGGDAKTLAALEEEFASELGGLKARAEALESRVSTLENEEEKFKVSGDFTVGALGAFEANDGGGFADATQAISRLRIAVEAPVMEGSEGGFLGEGRVKARAVAALGNNQGGLTSLSRIAADASNSNETFGTTSSTNSRQSLYLDRAGYEQDFNLFNNSHTLFAGILPWRDYFDKSAYRGNENTQFQNVALTNIAGMPANASVAMVGAKTNFMINDNMDTGLTIAYGAPNERNTQNNYFVNAEGRLNYKWADYDNRGTSLYVGLLGVFNDSVNQQPFNNGVQTNPVNRYNQANSVFYNSGGSDSHIAYVGLDQEIYRGIGFNATYMLNNQRSTGTALNAGNQNYGNTANSTSPNGYTQFGTNRVALNPQQTASFALNIPTGTLGFRDGDTIGVGYAIMDYDDSNDGRDRLDQVVESYYDWKLNDRVSIIPSVQTGFHPFGNSDNDMFFAGGLRTSIKF